MKKLWFYAVIAYISGGLSACYPTSVGELKQEAPAVNLRVTEPLGPLYARLTSNARRCHIWNDTIASEIYEVSGIATIDYITPLTTDNAFFARIELQSSGPNETDVAISAYRDRDRNDLIRWTNGGDGC